MKKKTFLTTCLSVFMAATLSLSAGCGETPDVNPPEGWKTEANYTDMETYRSYLKHDLDTLNSAIGATGDATVDAAVATELAAGKTAIEAATDITTAKAAYKAAAGKMIEAIPAANGVFNLSGVSTAERTKILGKVEEYCVRNGMLGTTLYENGRYVMYHDRITLGTENYIVGYGFGTLAEGDIKADLETENKAEWKRYMHSIMSEDPGTANYLNSQKSTVGDVYGYIGASYYTNFMNETKDGYIWAPELAVADPVAVGGLDANGQSATWRFEIRSGLKYTTFSEKTDRAAFNDRAVVAEDFLTPFKLLLNQANGYYRGGELAESSGAAAIVGAKEYYAATKSAEKGILSNEEADFGKVGIKIVEEGGKTYFQYTLGAPVTPFYARYYISSSLYAPIPKDFIDLVGTDNYLNFSQDKSSSPVDNSLSLGAYALERWDSGQQIVYKKNPNYVYADTKYKIQGVHINILEAAKEDKEAAIKEFLAGKTDSATIPDTYLKEYKSDPRTRVTGGDSCFKLNMNALDQETWIELFGENGSYSQTSKDKYWEVEPALSNAHFRSGLSYALNRKEFADIKGNIASVNYFSSDYMSDPEKGISYNETAEHKKAVSSLLEGTDDYGYSLELARDYFRMALDELEADGLITPGTHKNPHVIELEIAWQTPQDETSLHKYVKQYWETAFNDESVTGGFYKLDCKFWVGKEWSDVYYNKMLKGQYDIGLGSISGNPLDPLSFFNINSTDPAISHNFTLNWAVDTNTLTDALVYNGQRWSFDALYNATQEQSIVNNGTLGKAYGLTGLDVKKDADGGMDVTIELKNNALVEKLDLVKLVIFGGDSNEAYKEWSLDASTYTVTYDAEKDVLKIVVKVPASEIAKVPVADNQGIDVYFTFTLNGQTSSEIIVTAPVSFSEPAAE